MNRNVAASVRDRLLAQARASGADAQLIATRYVLERLLYRLSISPHKDRFVLKGAMLFPAWTDDIFRPTRDLDLLGSGENSPEALAQTFKEIFSQDAPQDGLVFDMDNISAIVIRNEKNYGGVRIKSVAQIGTARYPVQVDIGFGDAITPNPEEMDYPTLLDFPAPRLRAYPQATVVAEKFEAMVQIGFASTRIKDFYDVLVMSKLFEFEGAVLSAAISNTFERRRTKVPDKHPPALTVEFAEKPESTALWRQFIEENSLITADIKFETALSQIAEFVLPPATALSKKETFVLNWRPGGPWI